MIIVTSSFSKSSVYKVFSFHTKTQSPRCQIPPVIRAFSKSSVFVTDYCVYYCDGLVGLTVVGIKAAYSNFPGVFVNSA